MTNVILPPISVSIGATIKDSFGKDQFSFTPVWYQALLQTATNSNMLLSPATGDLSGLYPDLTVIGINGHSLGSTIPTSGNVLIANGTTWISKSVSGDATITSLGALTVSANAITNDKFRTSNGNTLVGNNTAGTANVRDLTVSDTKVMLSLDHVENTALSTWTGSTNLTTLGTITTGTWNGSSISTTYTDAKLKTLTGTTNRITISGTSTDPIVDISASYVGQSSITTVGTISSGTWHGSTIAEIYGGTNQSTYTLGDTLYSSASNTLSKLAGNTTTTKKFLRQTGDGVNSAAPTWDTIVSSDVPGSALTRTNDTNVTLTLGGSSSTALLNAASITAGWTGTLATGRGGTGVTSLGDLTSANDTNVTLTLGGTPTGALITSSSITAGWTGQLGLTRGGTNNSITADNGAIVYSDASKLTLLASTSTANKMFLSGSSAAPTWSTSTIPTSAGATANKVLLSDGTNYVLSTPTFPNASATSGKLIQSDGTNWIASTPTFPTAAPTLNKILQGDGTNWVQSTSAFPGSLSAGDIVYAASANSFTGVLAKDTNSTRYISNQGTSNDPSWNQVDLTNGVTGTLPVGSGGTGQTSYTDGQLLIGNTTGNTLAKATLTAGTGISVTNGHGTITVANTGVTSVATSGLATGGAITTTGTVTVTAAVKSDQTTGSSTSVAVVPGVQQNHDSACKVWGYCTVSGGAITTQASYNVSSMTYTSAGLYVVNLSTAFTTANYSINANLDVTSGTGRFAATTINSSSAFQVRVANLAYSANVDPPGFFFQAFGRQ